MTSDSDESLNEILDQQDIMLIAAATAAANTEAYFNDEEMILDNQRYVDPDDGVPDQLAILKKSPSFF